MPTETVSTTTQSNVISLFESPEPKLRTATSDGVAIVFSRGIAPKKNFHVATSDPEFVKTLEDNGGRYIKKYEAFRFKKHMERKVRSLAALCIDSRGDGGLYLKDNIRIDAELEVGATYRDELEESYWVLRAFDPNIEEKSVRVKFQKFSPEHDHFLQTFKSIGLSHISTSMEINPTNADELFHEYIGSKYKEAKDFTSQKELRDFLTEGGVVQFGEQELYVNYMPGPGTNVVTKRPAGKPREAERFLPRKPSVWTPSEAVDVLFRDHIPNTYLPSEMEQPTTEELTPVEETWFPMNEGIPEQTLLLRGHITTLQGRSSDGSYIYERNDGLRYAVTSNQELMAESPYVSESGAFLPPKVRDQSFCLRDELFEDFEAENVSSIFRNTQTDQSATLSSTTQSKVDLEKIGVDPSLIHRAIAKQIAFLNADEKDSFNRKKREKDSNDSYDQMTSRLAEVGYIIDKVAFDGVVNTVNQKLEATTSRLMLAMQAYHQYLELDKSPASLVMDVRELTVSKARQAPANWVRESLDNLQKRGLSASWALLVAKAYGTIEEISEAERLQSEEDEAVVSSFRNELQSRYQQVRDLTEIPDTITILERKVETDSQASPIPRESWQKQIRELHKELAGSQFDIESIRIDDEDLHSYRTLGSHSEIVSALADRHGFSFSAAGLYADRIGAELAERVHREFLASPEYLAGARAATIISDAIGSNRPVKIGSDYNSPAIEIPWGAGTISLGRPESMDGGSYYSVGIYHNAAPNDYQHSKISSRRFETLPSAEELSRLMIAFAATCDTKYDYWKAINVENRFGEQGSDKYSCTAIAKSIRAEVKNAKKNGVIPKDIKVSVRKDGHNSINLTLTAIPESFELYTPDYIEWYRNGEKHGFDHDSRPKKLTLEGHSLIQSLEAIREAWNFDKSDTMTDYFHVNYYGSTTIDSDLESEIIPRYRPELEQNIHNDSESTLNPLPTDFRRMLVEFEDSGSCHNEKLGVWAGITQHGDNYRITIDHNGKTDSLDISEAMNTKSGVLICLTTCSDILAQNFVRNFGLTSELTKETPKFTATPILEKYESSLRAPTISNTDEEERRPADYSKLAKVLSDRQSRIVGEIIRISEQEVDITASLYVDKNERTGSHTLYGFKSVLHEKRSWFSVDPTGNFCPLSDSDSIDIESKMENESPVYVKSDWSHELEQNDQSPLLGM